ncbi:MAG TPA: hypothetical protein VM118_15105 [Acidobacteriota bacterium]|nr:hypothetical protein [Acidobacteriota bacterium]
MRRLLRCGVLGLAVLALGCSSERSTNGKVDEPTGMYSDEPIVLAYSLPIEPVPPLGYPLMSVPSSCHSLRATSLADEYVFDLSYLPLVKEGRINDISILYFNTSSCDIDVEVWDNDRQQWRQFAFGSDGPCQAFSTGERHILSALAIGAADVLDADSQLRVRAFGHFGAPSLWATEVNPEYLMIPVSPQARFGRGGLAFGNGSLYSVSFSPFPGIYREDLSNGTELLFPARGSLGAPHGLAHDGESFWLADGTDSIFRLSQTGETLCAFSVPTDYPGGLTWDGANLWLAEYQGPDLRLFEIDPEESCRQGSAVITRTFPTPGGGCPGLAWDGTHLLVVSDSLYRVSRDGEVVQSYALPLLSVMDIAWDGSRVCMVSRGWGHPGRWFSDEWIISCFRLR